MGKHCFSSLRMWGRVWDGLDSLTRIDVEAGYRYSHENPLAMTVSQQREVLDHSTFPNFISSIQ
jgi:hypothetical protein